MASNAALSNLIIIDTGTLEVASGFAISDAGRVGFSSSRSGTLLVSKSETIGGLSGGSDSNGIVSIASEQTLTLAASGGSQTFAGRISGPGSLVKTNGGIQALTGANTFAGGTLVKAGALIVNGMNSTGSGVLTVSAGATLGGFGSVSGATSIAGIHSPGASPGVQTFLSDLTYEDLASVSWELISNTSEASARGADYDGVNVDGNLTFNGNVALDLSFNSAGSSVDWNDPFWSVSQNWVLYQVALSTTGAINLQLNPVDWLDANGSSFNAVRGGSGSTFSVSKSGENIVLSYNVVPEPSTYALLLMTGAGALWWARRRR
jgi:autotransporter-associated beta strand protein